MKRFLLMLLSLVMVLGSLGVMPMVSAEGEAETTILDSGDEFIDIAYDGNGTYVAMVKDSASFAYGRLWYSKDGGITWAKSTNQPLRNNPGTITTNAKSQQQLVYWKDKELFVAHGAKSTYTSSDGVTWTDTNYIHWITESMLVTDAEKLIIGGLSGNYPAVNFTDEISGETKQFGAHKYDGKYGATFPAMSSQVKAVGAKTVGDDTVVFTEGGKTPYIMNYNKTTGWSTLNRRNMEELDKFVPYDMIYSEKSDQFISVDGSETVHVTPASGAAPVFCPVAPAENRKVTGIGISDKYIVTGMSDGTMYYTENSEQGITAETVWTQISAESGTTVCTEPVKNIEFSDDDNFVALSTTQIYKGNVRHYANVREYRALEKPQISKGNTFAGVKLIGGIYTQINGENVYVVYGNTTDETPQGKLFVKTGNADWELVHTDDYIFSTEKNGAVWWTAKNMFVVSMAHNSNPTSGRLLTSADGRTWTPVDGTVTDFRNGANIQILGDYLYAANNGKAMYRYSELKKSEREETDLSGVIPQDAPMKYYNQIALGGSADNPAIFVGGGYQGLIRNNEQAADIETEKWKFLSGIGNANVLDAVYSENSKKFVVLVNGNFRTSIIAKDGTVVQGPVVAGGIVCNAIDTNGREFMFAGADGNIYTAPDTAEFAKDVTPLVKVSTASGTAENTMNVTNVFKAGADTFIATASNNTDSDVLLIKKNGSAYEYTKASDNSKAESVVPGDTVNVSVKGTNLRTDAYPFTMVTAVYATDGTLLQSQTDSLAIPAQSSGATVTATVKWSEDLPTDATVKVFLWDSMSGMVPLREVAVNPF